jgi:hypothetical protein
MSTPDNPSKPGPRLVTDSDLAIPKPDERSTIEKFRSKRDPSIGTVATLLTALPHHSIAHAHDFVRLHPDREMYWSPELCFVSVPIKGQKNNLLHLIDDEVAARNNLSGLKRFRLALAAMPGDKFFLCHVPTTNLDNAWNYTAITGCDTAITSWVKVISRKAEGVDGYLIRHAEDPKAFPDPKWPKQSLDEILTATFAAAGLGIDNDNHPALLRLLGRTQNLK